MLRPVAQPNFAKQQEFSALKKNAIELNIMRRRGRKSADELALNVIDCAQRQLEPPVFLSKAERSIFTEIAASAAHLRPVDVPLLASLVQAAALAHRLARNPARIGDWERAASTQASLSTKLRLTPQSRTDSCAAGRAAEAPVPRPYPWERPENAQ
jgi:hypothetical protein